MTRAVILDFYGTLARAAAFGVTFEDVFARWGLRYDETTWIEPYDGLEHVEHSASRDQYVAWELERLREIADAAGIGAWDMDEVLADLREASQDFTLEAYEEVPEVLGELRNRGVTVAVCSNWGWDLDVALAQAGLDDLVDVAVTSAQAGARKPHPRIFRHTLEQVGVQPAEAVFVGDSWAPDIEGPRALGLRAVHVLRPDRAEAGAKAPAVFDGIRRIPDLRPLPDLLRGKFWC